MIHIYSLWWLENIIFADKNYLYLLQFKMYVWICDCSRLSLNLLILLLIKFILLFRLRLAKCKKRTILRQRIERKTCGIGLFYILLYQLYAYTSSVESSWTSVLSWRRISCGKYAHSLHFQNQFNKQLCNSQFNWTHCDTLLFKEM